ncbi:MAG: hypothetical protein V3T64_02205 [Myxococcota bacterium]
MARAIRQHRRSTRASERIPLHARLHVTSLDGKPIAPLSRCTKIGIGGLQGCAASGMAPGTRVLVAVQLPSGRVFEARGHVAWAKTTLHLALFGAPRGMDDDALFGIKFDNPSPDDLLPIARLLAARDRQRRRTRQIRRLRPLLIRA